MEKVVDFVKLGKRGRLLKVKVETVNAKEDVAGAKCKNAFEHLKAKLSLFGVIDSGWIWDKNKDAVWWFVLKTDLLDCEFEFVGPPLAMVDAVKQFKAHNKKTYVKGSRVCVKKKRDKTNLNDVVVECLNGEFIKSRVLSATL